MKSPIAVQSSEPLARCRPSGAKATQFTAAYVITCVNVCVCVCICIPTYLSNVYVCVNLPIHLFIYISLSLSLSLSFSFSLSLSLSLSQFTAAVCPSGPSSWNNDNNISSSNHELLVLRSSRPPCARRAPAPLGHANMYPWKHATLDFENREIPSTMDWTRQVSNLLKTMSTKAPQGLYAPRVHVRIFDPRRSRRPGARASRPSPPSRSRRRRLNMLKNLSKHGFEHLN